MLHRPSERFSVVGAEICSGPHVSATARGASTEDVGVGTFELSRSKSLLIVDVNLRSSGFSGERLGSIWPLAIPLSMRSNDPPANPGQADRSADASSWHAGAVQCAELSVVRLASVEARSC